MVSVLYKAGAPGRPKGARGKKTEEAHEMFKLAFRTIGGPRALAKWAKDEPTEFYKLYAKLIPVEQRITGKDGESLSGVVLLPAVRASDSDSDADRSPKSRAETR